MVTPGEMGTKDRISTIENHTKKSQVANGNYAAIKHSGLGNVCNRDLFVGGIPLERDVFFRQCNLQSIVEIKSKTGNDNLYCPVSV